MTTTIYDLGRNGEIEKVVTLRSWDEQARFIKFGLYDQRPSLDTSLTPREREVESLLYKLRVDYHLGRNGRSQE